MNLHFESANKISEEKETEQFLRSRFSRLTVDDGIEGKSTPGVNNRLGRESRHLIQSSRSESSISSELDRVIEKNEKLTREIEQQKLAINELTETNSHLITATWREREMKKKLSDALDKLSTSKQLIEEQNKMISSSINYAKRLQNCLNPNEAKLARFFPDSMLLSKPRNIVSGDFPWIYQSGDFVYFGVIDCTGHGVPGAMLAALGQMALNQIMDCGEAVTTGGILSALQGKIFGILNQNNPEHTLDGMDLGIVRVNLKTNAIQFSGAKRPLIIQSGGLIQKIKGNRFSIGEDNQTKFESNDIQLETGDSVFLFSDGITDQFGSEESQETDKSRRFGANRLSEVIQTYSSENLCDFKSNLAQSLTDWQGNEEQTDDMLILGVRL